MSNGSDPEKVFPASEVTWRHRRRGIWRARRLGHLIVECGPSALDGHQTLTINPADESDAHLWLDWRQPHSIEGTDTQFRIATGHISELAYQGVQRRQGRLRRYQYHDIPAVEILQGDRIAFRIADELFSSQPVMGIIAEPEAVVAGRELHVPKLALSTE